MTESLTGSKQYTPLKLRFAGGIMKVHVYLVTVVELEGCKRGEHPALILKMENAPCPFGLAPCPFKYIKTRICNFWLKSKFFSRVF